MSSKNPTELMFGNNWSISDEWFTLALIINGRNTKLISFALFEIANVALCATTEFTHWCPFARLLVFLFHQVVAHRFPTIRL